MIKFHFNSNTMIVQHMIKRKNILGKSIGFLMCLLLNQLCVIQVNAQKLKKDKPNIIIIYCDDMGYGDIGINGHPGIKTPHIDQMAMEGMRFSNYYSASPACTASRYALLTGRYPIHSGFRWVLNPDSERGIHSQEKTLAEGMKEAGYRTAIFGKWHLGSTQRSYLPLQNGFDEYVGLPYSNDMIPPKYPDIALMHGNDTLEMNPDQSKLTSLYTKHALDFIRRNRKDNFFLYLPYAMPHVPLHPGKSFVGSSQRGAYGDVIQEIDYYVGQLLNEIKKLGIAKNTIVWFMSDNGPWLLQKEQGGSAGLFKDGKGSTWEGGMRVPCIVWNPGRVTPGAVNNNLVNAMDIYKTSIAFAQGKEPVGPHLDGENIATYLSEANVQCDSAARTFFYYGVDNALMAVRRGNWKLHVKTYSQLGKTYFNDELPLLFNLAEDPSENYNLAGTHPTLVKELQKLIADQNKRVGEEGTFWDREN